jgi:hypothetical protein
MQQVIGEPVRTVLGPREHERFTSNPRSSNWTSSVDLRSCDTGYTACVIPLAGAAVRCWLIVRGCFSMSAASARSAAASSR